MLRPWRQALSKALTGRMRGRLQRALDGLAVTIDRTATIIAQARSRLSRTMPDSSARLVSLHDPDARPIRKGRIDRPVEFGYKAQVTENDDGIVLDYAVEYGAAPTARSSRRHGTDRPARRLRAPGRDRRPWLRTGCRRT